MNCVVGNDWLNNSDDDEDIEINSKTIKNILNINPVITNDIKKINSINTDAKPSSEMVEVFEDEKDNVVNRLNEINGKEKLNVVESEKFYTKEPKINEQRLHLIQLLTKHRSEAIDISNVIATCFDSKHLQNVYKEIVKTKIEESFNSTISAIGEDLFELTNLIDELLVIPLETKLHVEQEQKNHKNNRNVNVKCEKMWVKLTITCALFCVGVSYCIN